MVPRPQGDTIGCTVRWESCRRPLFGVVRVSAVSRPYLLRSGNAPTQGLFLLRVLPFARQIDAVTVRLLQPDCGAHTTRYRRDASRAGSATL